MVSKIKFKCTTNHCFNNCQIIEPANKFKKFNKVIHDQYCYDCNSKLNESLKLTPTAKTVAKVLSHQMKAK
jgi:hypothetical protein